MTLSHAPLVQHHAANAAGRDFIVGDLHGCVEALRYLLREVDFDTARDRLFSVGDLVDRGDRAQCEEALALIDKPWFYAVLGNHEDTLCAVAEGRMPRHRWYGIGGGWAQGLSADALMQYALRLRRLPLARVVGEGVERFNVLHAEFLGSDADLDRANIDMETRDRMLWGRDIVLGSAQAPPRQVLSLTYVGHTPVREVRLIGSQMFLDTGAFIPEGRLTMVEALTTRRWSVSTAEARAHGAATIALP
ncbi:metallophosphoesterase [Paraburkholderia acidisoli]|uniref:Metallophosphoesterase n=1 Tax=Paraburkholderia acidisoli TaxID=2571748 RepID=A0A7Z2JHR3_9BURK|nr:metallophosphoesterase [Paraburkholderia acidisoli]QGZ63654.1 metallophosphoesterase [Paraburkholderia acidisoli]